MPDGFIERDDESGRLFYVPDHITVHDRSTGVSLDGTFRLNSENGAAIAETAYVDLAAKIGKRVIIGSHSRVHQATLEDDVDVAGRVQIYCGAVLHQGVIVGRKSTVGADCTVESGATVSLRTNIGAGTVIEKDVIVPPRQMVPPHSNISLADAEELQTLRLA